MLNLKSIRISISIRRENIWGAKNEDEMGRQKGRNETESKQRRKWTEETQERGEGSISFLLTQFFLGKYCSESVSLRSDS